MLTWGRPPTLPTAASVAVNSGLRGADSTKIRTPNLGVDGIGVGSSLLSHGWPRQILKGKRLRLLRPEKKQRKSWPEAAFAASTVEVDTVADARDSKSRTGPAGRSFCSVERQAFSKRLFYGPACEGSADKH